MFSPNSVGKLLSLSKRDEYGRSTYSAPVSCAFAPVNLLIGSQKTSVRADSSASRGSADETVALRAKILVASYVKIEIGDRFEFDGVPYQIAGKHVRRSVTGVIDHFECDMEMLPK